MISHQLYPSAPTTFEPYYQQQPSTDMFAYTYQSAPAPRQYSGTSSAFSAAAGPDEDWTKISDLAERRRIQNRIAQRNYRKKLKRRLEDLERRAGSSDSTDEKSTTTSSSTSSNSRSSSNSTKRTSPKKTAAVRQQQPSPPPAAALSPPRNTAQFTPPMQPEDEMLFSYPTARSRSHSPPSLFGGYSYPAPPEDASMMMAPYTTSPPASQYTTARVPVTAADYHPHHDYLVSGAVPVTLPSMTHFSDAINKRDPTAAVAGFGDDMAPYMGAAGYGYLSTMDVTAPYDHSNPHTSFEGPSMYQPRR